MAIAGGCLCGQVRYEAGGPPVFSLVCHCADCRKSSGSGHVPVMGVAKAGFRVTGEVRSFGYTGGSGVATARNFCPACGSVLFGTPSVAPDIVTIYAGSLDDPAQFSPEQAIFVDGRPDWARLAADLPEFAAAPPEE